MAIEDHFRWPVERRLNSDHAKGDLFQVTWLGWPVHGFTHMDSPRHFLADGKTTSDIPLEATVGEGGGRPDAARAEPGDHRRAWRNGRRTCGPATSWSQELLGAAALAETPEFWTDAPYMSRAAAEWLLARGRARSPSTSLRTTPSVCCCAARSGRSRSTSP